MEKKNKDFYMLKALGQAKKALQKNEVPVGAIIVDEHDTIIARGYNKIETKQCHTAHAEIIAIQKACKFRENWRLNGCTMYVTLEPCQMCLGLIQLSRLSSIVFGAPSTLFGTNLLGRPSFAKNLTVEGGVKEKECIELLRLFFSDKRKKRKDSCEIKNRIHPKDKTVTRQAQK